MIPRVIAATAADAAFLGAAWIAEHARKALHARGGFSVALAGGESPKPLYEALRARDDIDWARWDLFLGDERAVPESDPRSNLRGVRECLLSKVAVDPERVHGMYAEGLSLGAMASASERTLRDLLGLHPVFDLVILGVGRDAHTLSLHPGCPAIDEGDEGRAVVGLRAPPMDPAVDRITLTPPVVRRARSVLLFAHGASKADAVRAVLDDPDDRHRYPAQILRDAKGEVLCLLDEAAASRAPSCATQRA